MNGGANSTNRLYSYYIPLVGGYDANGNLLKATDFVMGMWTYTYDNLNRLSSATAPTPQPTGVNASYGGIQTAWGYDNFGNRLSESSSVVPGTSPAPQASMPAATSATYTTSNQMNSVAYDAAGDVTNDGLNQYLYDAEGRVCALKNSNSSLTGYIYDAAGIRVAKGSLTSFSCNFSTNGFAATTSWALGQGNEQIGEWKLTSGAWTWQHSNAYADGKLLGTYDNSGLHFYFDDWLGTRRVQTNALGQVELTCASLAYGNGQNCTGTGLSTSEDPTEQHFTGKEYDTESGNDYFDARYYSNAAGRFLSPDWSAKEEPIPYAKLDDPQSLNLYGYVRNHPMTSVDADGHQENVAVVIQHGKSYEGTLCGNHECVAYVKEAGGFTTQTKDWKAGPSVLDFADKGLQSGTAIMLADKEGNYPKTGSMHAAEFVQFNKDKNGNITGIKVRDQWAARYDKKGNKIRDDQPVHTHDLPNKNGTGNPIGDASQYHILMIPKPKDKK
jgi:RHS repeat-associated protein